VDFSLVADFSSPLSGIDSSLYIFLKYALAKYNYQIHIMHKKELAASTVD